MKVPLIVGGIALVGVLAVSLTRQAEEERLEDQRLEDQRLEEERLEEERLTAEEALRLAEEEAAIAEEERQLFNLQQQALREANELAEREAYERAQDEIRLAAIAEQEKAEALLQNQRDEDARKALVEQERLDAERELEQERQRDAQALQALFWQQEKDEQQRLLALEDIRIAEEAARIPVIIPHGPLRLDPNIAIASGGAKDIMDITWGYKYVSGQPHLFIAMKVIWKGGRTDQTPVHAASPGAEMSNYRHRIGAGIFQPGTHSVTVQMLSTPTTHNEWTVHFEETKTFTIAEPFGYQKNSEEMGNELGWAVYRQGMGFNEYKNSWQAWFAGKNMRVTETWIRQWYAGAQVGVRGKKMREGQLGYDRQHRLHAP